MARYSLGFLADLVSTIFFEGGLPRAQRRAVNFDGVTLTDNASEQWLDAKVLISDTHVDPDAQIDGAKIVPSFDEPITTTDDVAAPGGFVADGTHYGYNSITYAQGATSILVSQADSGGAAAPMTIQAQRAGSGVGGQLTIGGGQGATPGTNKAGNTLVQLGQAVGGDSASLSCYAGASEVCRIGLVNTSQCEVLGVSGSLVLRSASSVAIRAPSLILRDAGAVDRCTIGIGPAFSVDIDAGCSSVVIGQAQDPSAAGAAMSVRAQQGASGFVGGNLTIGGGDPGTAGTVKAGATAVQLGAQVTEVCANFELLSGATKLMVIRSRPASGTHLAFGDPDGTYRPGLIEGSSFNLEARTTLLSLVSITGLYMSDNGGTFYRRRAGVTCVTEQLNTAGVCSETWASGVTSVEFQHNGLTRVQFDANNVYLQAEAGKSVGHRFRGAAAQAQAKREHLFDTVVTGDATATAVLTVAIPTGCVVHIRWTMNARNVSVVTDAATYERVSTFVNNAGTVTQIGTTSSLHTAEATAGWDVSTNISGANVQLRGSGAAATNIRWECHAEVTYGSA